MRAELRIPDEQSLKGKRRTLRPHLEHLRRLRSLSVAEVDHHDSWQRATIGVAAVGATKAQLESLVDTVQRYLDSQSDVELIELDVRHVGIDDE